MRGRPLLARPLRGPRIPKPVSILFFIILTAIVLRFTFFRPAGAADPAIDSAEIDPPTRHIRADPVDLLKQSVHAGAEKLAHLHAEKHFAHDPRAVRLGHDIAQKVGDLSRLAHVPEHEQEASVFADQTLPAMVALNGTVIRDFRQWLHDKVVIVVNVASHCGYTDLNYAELQRLYATYKSKGLEVIAFPCNQFAQQENGTNAEIVDFAVRQKHATFTIMEKVDVNGPDAHPFYRALKRRLSVPTLSWNFCKFLIAPGGIPTRYITQDVPFSVVESMLAPFFSDHPRHIGGSGAVHPPSKEGDPRKLDNELQHAELANRVKRWKERNHVV